MGIGGKGFLLFAKLQPDTPGKLLAHALSYEGLEVAWYELLTRVAERAGDERVAEAATRIRDEERTMMQRLEANLDQAVEASLREHPRDDLGTLLRRYLSDAHAIEEQEIALLERASKLVEDPRLESIFTDHLAETRDHAELIQERLNALGDDPSSLKDAGMRLGALNWSTFFQGHPDSPGKLTAFAYAFEYLETGGYEQLKRVAQRVGDAQTVRLVDHILEQERVAATKLAGAFNVATLVTLRSVGMS